MVSLLQTGIDLAERGLIPDALTRAAIRQFCARTARSALEDHSLQESERFIESLRDQDLAEFPEKANEQHYELPAEFFELFLGPRRKYSCCVFQDAKTTLAQAEEDALRDTVERACLEDGQQILELGCGWGSLSLWMAEHFPNSFIVAVSNSNSQRAHIERLAKQRSLANLQVLTIDINRFDPRRKFDRIVSVEMFEHLKNMEEMLRRVATWLKPHGKLFIHHFCHRNLTYPFDVDGADNWMGRYFFTGGLMPSANLLSRFSSDFAVSQQWSWSGVHYRRTADAWLWALDANRREAIEILKRVYGEKHANRWFHRWRIFLLAVSEVFGFRNGSEWFVRHVLLEPVGATVPSAKLIRHIEEGQRK
jgi:cyclopropane-fatty-acyl-phospholipid synthase